MTTVDWGINVGQGIGMQVAAHAMCEAMRKLKIERSPPNMTAEIIQIMSEELRE